MFAAAVAFAVAFAFIAFLGDAIVYLFPPCIFMPCVIRSVRVVVYVVADSVVHQLSRG